MKRSLNLNPCCKTLLFIAVVFGFSLSVQSQSDTLHLYYKGLLTQTTDSNEAKIGMWAKSLNGQHMDVQVLAYYDKNDYKSYSQERADEMFLALNRKARELISIKFIGPKKGEKSQRSTVDIVYSLTGSGNKPKAKVAAELKEKEPKKEKVKEQEKEKMAVEEKDEDKKEPKEKEKKEKKVEEKKEKKEDAKEEEKVAEKKEKPKKAPKEKEINTELYEYDSLYVNGELKVTKRKIKKKKD